MPAPGGWSIWGADLDGISRHCRPLQWRSTALPPCWNGSAALLRHRPGSGPTLRALPFATGSLDAAWAERSLVHLRRSLVPMALWDLHRSLRVGAKVCLKLFEGRPEHGQVDDDDVPGRWFSAWPEPLLRQVLSGAGFGVDLLERRGGGTVDDLQVWATRQRTLADTVGPGMRLLLVGLNPSLVAADAGVAFHRRGNRAWPALAAGRSGDGGPRPVQLLRQHRIGMTDLVKRASPRADGLSAGEYLAGIDRLESLCSWLAPDVVCMVGTPPGGAPRWTGAPPPASSADAWAADPCT